MKGDDSTRQGDDQRTTLEAEAKEDGSPHNKSEDDGGISMGKGEDILVVATKVLPQRDGDDDDMAGVDLSLVKMASNIWGVIMIKHLM